MAWSDFKLSDSLNVVLVALLAGAVVKTTVDHGGDARAASAQGTSKRTKKTAPKKELQDEPTAGELAVRADVPALVDPADVVGLAQRELGYPAGETDSTRPHRVTSFDVVIASLPDPTTSGFVQGLDEGLEAIQAAAQSARYTVAHHWLPWQRGAGASTERADARRAGWVLMRQDGDDTKIRMLLILLVGERLGGGIQGDMLADALAIRTKLDPKGPLLVLGPYFSGTAASLRDGLEAWCRAAPDACAGQRAEIVSGSATRWLNASILQGTVGLHVRFRATVNPDGALSTAMHQFLGSALAIDESHIAELTETSTQFGVAHAKTADQNAPKAQSKKTKGNAPEEPPSPLRISFPAHLPDLHAWAGGALEFHDEDASVDWVPQQSLGSLAESKHVVASTIDALRARGVTDVGVLATATRDKISLVTALRDTAPDIRPHVYEANLSLADPDQHAAMDGTLVASSYPVTSATQLWSGRRDIQPFPSDAAEGIYNALLALLWSHGRVDPTTLAGALRDYRFPFGSGKPAGPPVWISVIVGAEVWPLAVYPFGFTPGSQYVFGRPDPTDGAKAVEMESALASDGGEDPHLERSRLATAALVLLFVLVLGNVLALVRPLPALRRCPFLLFYDPDPGPAPAAAKTQSLLDLLETSALRDEGMRPAILFGTWITALIGLAAASLYELPRLLATSAAALTLGDIVAGLLVVVSALLILSPFLARPPRPERPLDRWRELLHPSHWIRGVLHGLLVAGALLCAILSLSEFTRLGGETDGRAFFFFARLMNPSLGLTAALPLALMGIALYVACLFRLRVVRRAACLRAVSASWKGDAIPGAAEGMRRFADDSLRSLARILWAGAGVGVVLYLWTRVRPRTLEGPKFDLLVALGFGLTFAVAVASIWRADRLWRRLASYLRGLAIHPFARAFSTLPSNVSQVFRTPMPGRIDHREIASACEETARLAAQNPVAAQWGARGAPPADLVPTYLEELAPKWLEPGVLPPPLAGEERPPAGVQLREHVLALRMAEALSYMCDATRTTLFVGSSAAVAAVLAMSSYPFQPGGTLAWAARISIVVVVLVAIRVIAGIERDEVLSHIAGTQAGKVTPSWSLATRVLGYVVVPLATLAAAHLPDHGLLSGLLRAIGGSGLGAGDK